MLIFAMIVSISITSGFHGGVEETMNQATLPNYEQRLEEFKKVKTRILSILLDFPSGLTHGEVVQEYMQRFRHVALLDNRLRELRKEGEVESFHREGSATLVWRLTEKWKNKP